MAIFACKSCVTYQFMQGEEFLGLSSNYSLRGKQTLVDKVGPFGNFAQMLWSCLIWSSSEISALSNVACKPSFLLAYSVAWKSPAVQND